MVAPSMNGSTTPPRTRPDRVSALDLGEVGRRRTLEHHRKARIECERHARRAAQAVSSCTVKQNQVSTGGSSSSRRSQSGAADTVVDRLGLDEAVAELDNSGVEYAVIAERYQLFRGSAARRADVDIEIFCFRHGAALGGGRQMDGLDADDAREHHRSAPDGR